jgi:DNA-binding response OmpR family regulator
MAQDIQNNILIFSKKKYFTDLLSQYSSNYKFDKIENVQIIFELLNSGKFLLLIFEESDPSHFELLESYYSNNSLNIPILFIGNKLSNSLNNNFYSLKKPIAFNQFIDAFENILSENKRANLQINENICINLITKDISIKLPNGLNSCIQITEKEMNLIKYLFERNEEVSKEEILTNLWGYNESSDTHTVETHIYRLRQKIGNDIELIRTGEKGYYISL